MAQGFGCIVIGPAGSGKSTLCHVLQDVGAAMGRSYKICNLDPAAEVFKYRCDIDIRDLISLDDVQESENWGPNGGLIYCMEHLIENIDWLIDELADFADDSFVLFDCPGQIELYSHLDVMTRLCKTITKAGFNVCATYCADGTQVTEPTKYISTCLTSISTMVQLQLPHLNVMTKCDKIQDKEFLDRISDLQTCQELFLEQPYCEFSNPVKNVPLIKEEEEGEEKPSEEKKEIEDPMDQRMKLQFFNKKYFKLNQCIMEVIDNYSLVNYQQIDIQDEESVSNAMAAIDNLVQYDEYRMPKDSKFLDNQESEAVNGVDY